MLVLQFKTLETSQNESKCHHASNITHYPALAQHVKERKRERNALKTHGAETRKTSIGIMQDSVEENRIYAYFLFHINSFPASDFFEKSWQPFLMIFTKMSWPPEYVL